MNTSIQTTSGTRLLMQASWPKAKMRQLQNTVCCDIGVHKSNQAIVHCEEAAREEQQRRKDSCRRSLKGVRRCRWRSFRLLEPNYSIRNARLEIRRKTWDCRGRALIWPRKGYLTHGAWRKLRDTQKQISKLKCLMLKRARPASPGDKRSGMPSIT